MTVDNVVYCSNSTGGTLNSSYTKPTAPPHVGRNSSDSDSDSSDEELSSPAIIKSKAEPDPSMEIDPTSTGKCVSSAMKGKPHHTRPIYDKFLSCVWGY